MRYKHKCIIILRALFVTASLGHIATHYMCRSVISKNQENILSHDAVMDRGSKELKLQYMESLTDAIDMTESYVEANVTMSVLILILAVALFVMRSRNPEKS